MDMQFSGEFDEEFDCEILPEKTETKLCCEGDLSGLELLAAAASMYVDSDNPIKEGIVIEDSSIPKCFDEASLVADSVLDPECNKSDFVIVQEAVIGHSQLLNSTSVTAQGQLGSVENEDKTRSTLKVDRRHWDLNTVMDAWDNPYDDSICINICEDVNDDIVPQIQTHEKLEYLALPNLNCTRVGSPTVKVEEVKLKVESPKEIFVHLSSNEDHLEEPNHNISTNAASESFAEVNEKDVDFLTTSVSSTVGVDKFESPVALVEKIDQNVDVPHDLDMYLEGQDHLVDRTEIMSQEGWDSPYEDGELRGSFVYSWEDNELDINYVDYETNRRNDGSDAADFHGSDIVDGGSEGSHGSDKKSLLKGLSSSGNKSDCRVLNRSVRKYIMKATSKIDKIGGKNASNEESATDENEEGSKKIFTDLSAVDDKVVQVDEHMLKSRKLQSSTSYSSLDAVDENDVFFMKQCRSRRRSCLESCSERDTFFDKYSSRYRPHFDERDVADKWTNWGSRGHCSSAHHGFEGRSMASDDRDDSFGARGRLPGARYEGMNMRGNYPLFAGRQFDTRTDDIPSVWMSHSTSRRKRSLSPSSGKRFHVSTHERSPSRLGTRTPMAWHSLVERNSNTKGHVRSLDLRSDARTDQIRLPFSKSSLSSDHRRKRGYLSPPRGRLSRDRNDRWSDKHYFEDNRPMKRRREPVRVFRHSQRLNIVTSGRTKSDEFFRPTIHPRRFSFIQGDVTDCKIENSEERKRDSGGGVIHRGRYVGDVGNMRRFRQTTASDDFEIRNSIEDDVRAYAKDVPQRWERKRPRESFKTS